MERVRTEEEQMNRLACLAFTDNVLTIVESPEFAVVRIAAEGLYRTNGCTTLDQKELAQLAAAVAYLDSLNPSVTGGHQAISEMVAARYVELNGTEKVLIDRLADAIASAWFRACVPGSDIANDEELK